MKILFLMLIVLTVYVVSGLTVSSEIFSQTLNTLQLMDNHVDSLFTHYLALQGEPYSDPDFILPDIQIINIPTAAISYDDFMRQSDDTRLRQNHLIYTILTRFMHAVMDDQRELNPAEDGLIANFEVALGTMDVLVSTVSSILEQMSIPPINSLPDPLVLTYGNGNSFQKKLRGYVVCRELKDWVMRSTRDFTILNKKYGEQK